MARDNGCGTLLLIAGVVALFALTIYGITSDFRLGMATNLEPLRSFSYLLGVSASLMFIPLVLLCTPQVLRTHYFVGLGIITIWSGVTTAVLGTTLSIADLPATYCRLTRDSPSILREVCAMIKIVRWNAWFTWALGMILTVYILRGLFIRYLVIVGFPLAVAVFQLVQAVYAEGVGYAAVSWVLGLSSSLMFIYYIVSPFWFRPSVPSLNIHITLQFCIWLAMSTGFIGSTVLFLESPKAPCSSYFCRARVPVLVLSLVAWCLLITSFSVLLAARLSPRLRPWINQTSEFPILPQSIIHAIPPILHCTGIVFQLAIARDKLISSSGLQRLAVFLTACSCASLALIMFVTTVQNRIIAFMTSMAIWWQPVILLPALGIPAFMTYSTVAYVIEYTKQPSDRCSRDAIYSSSLYCRWQLVALVFSWILWLFCLPAALYIASCSTLDLRRRWLGHAAERRQWEDFRANAPPMGGHVQDASADSATPLVTALLPAGGQGKENAQPAGGAGGSAPAPQWVALTELFSGFRRNQDTS